MNWWTRSSMMRLSCLAGVGSLMILGVYFRFLIQDISGTPGRHPASFVDKLFVGFAFLGMAVCLLSVRCLRAGASRNFWTKDKAMRLRRWVNNRSLSLYAFLAFCVAVPQFFARSHHHLALGSLLIFPLQIFLAVDRCVELVVSSESSERSTLWESGRMLPLTSEHWGEPRQSEHRISQ
jgi:hypothetical protein